MALRGSALLVLIVGTIFSLALEVGAQQTQDTWRDLATINVDLRRPNSRIDLSSNETRTRAIRLRSDKDLQIEDLQVSYASGRIDYVSNQIVLRAGVPSAPIAVREVSLIVETVSLNIKTTANGQAANLSISGLVDKSAAGENIKPPPPFKSRGPADTKYVELGIHYATTRKREADREKSGQTLVSFSGEKAEATTLGYAIVTVPKEREAGTIPRPTFDFILQFRREDPSREFTIAKVSALNQPEFYASIGKQSADASTFRRQALVFIHGFNVTFDDGLYHAAQLAYDTGFDGPAILFSWSSRGNLLSYLYDRELARASVRALKELFAKLGQDKNIDAVHVVAHSMGNEPLVLMLNEQAEIAKSGGKLLPMKLGEVVFAAPDVAKDSFGELAGVLGPVMKQAGTLYASNKDIALGISGRVANPIDRAGYVAAGKAPLIVSGIDTIDMSAASWIFGLNHSTFSERRHMIDDLTLLFKSGKHPPSDRFVVFRTIKVPAGTYWKYK